MNKHAKTNSIRIIAGKWRGRRLPVLDHDGLRPTTDRVRETLFNWLMHDVPGARCLDLFAGSGALGLECLSRGAEKVLFVEANKRVGAQLQQNLQTLDTTDAAEVLVMNAMSFLERAPQAAFDLVFLDPPFASELWSQSMRLLSENGFLTDDALIYVEQPSKQDPFSTPGWSVYREGKAGHCRYTLYRP